MTTTVDASALLALMLDEPGGADVAALVENAVVSAVNLCEVMTRAVDLGHPADAVRALIREAPVKIVPFTEEHAIDAAALRGVSRHLGLSLGDRACLALARSIGGPALTADRKWAELDLGIDIQLIR